MSTCEDSVELVCRTSEMVVDDGDVDHLVRGDIGDRLGELVVEPLLSLDIGSKVESGGCSVSQSDSKEPDHGLDHFEGEIGDAAEPCSIPVADTNCEVVTDLKCDDVVGNVGSIGLGLCRICVDETQGKQEDSSHEGLAVPVASAFSVVTGDNKRGCTVGSENPSIQSLVEDDSNGTFARGVDDMSSKSLLTPDEVKLNVDPVLVGASDHALKVSEDNSSTYNNIHELKFPDVPSLPLSLRRSSRARKSFQKVQEEKPATKCTKKASKLTHGGTIDFLVNAIRKKRSCTSKSNKPLCPSGWGPSANLSKYFESSSEAGITAVSSKGLKKGKSSGKSRKKKASKVVVSTKSTEGEQEVAYRPIRLKVTFGKKDDKTNAESRPVGIDALCNLSLGNVSHHRDLCSYVESTEGNLPNGSPNKEMAILKRGSNSVEHVQFPGTDLESCSMLEKSTQTGSGPLEAEKVSSSHVDKYVNPGTSPDSEVIDQILDSTTGVSASIEILKPVNNESTGASDPGNESYQLPAKKSKKKRNKKDKVPQAGNPDVEDKLLCQTSSTKAKVSKKAGKQKEKNVSCAADVVITAPSENPSSNTCGSELISSEGPQNGADDNIFSGVGFGVESADSGNSCQLRPLDQSCGDKSANPSNSKGRSRNKSNITNASRKKKDPSGQLKADKRKVMSNCVLNMDGISCEAYNESHQLETGKFITFDVEKTDMGNGLAPDNQSCQTVLSTEVAEPMLPPRIAWVCCDECNKWRCIPAELADAIEATNSRWTCKDNQDEAFADCSISQEKSNSDINAELQISDEEEARDGYLGSKGSGVMNAVGSQSSTWMRINSNLYMHRSRKTQTVDEIMVCHCKASTEGGLGCGSQCLNRMLNIECVQGTCPCGGLCSNQRFQRQQYAKLSWFRCGKKGYGLQVLEDISKGQFLIEYVGEVLDLQAYESRQKEYASHGHKHFYFMTLNGNEVIDACVKGNLGRFVNHSCDPNCRTEKWVVNGEICVGLFALRNIRKGEELTFDYNYVRVFGAAAKKCHCGSDKCRGYIGGDLRNAEVIVHGDSDDEFPEPIVVDENGEIDRSIGNIMDRMKLKDNEPGPSVDNSCQEHVKGILEAEETANKMEKSPIDVGGLLPALTEKNAINETHGSSDNLAALQTEDLNNGAQFSTNPPTSTAEQTVGTSTSSPVKNVLLMKRMVKDSLAGSVNSSGKMSEGDNVECERSSKPRPRMKISRPFKSIKHRKPNSNSVSAEKGPIMTQRFQLLSCRPKKLFEGSANCNLEAVEEKLNELLDCDGGICKRKDASKGYLKLLLLTAASGDSCHDGAIQSNRDLSMILDAILKTKSRGVLLDIINKNGLQMLHNMMKLYRKDFKKIPILRKLLKVFEFLAEKEILTVERINGDSIHPGVESFQESILSFTEHNDKKVHQIARNFRDRWIPRSMRKVNRRVNTGRNRELDKGPEYCRSFETHHHWRDHDARLTEPMDCSDQMVISQKSTDTTPQEVSPPKICDSQPIVTPRRKRKSRWDQPADPVSPQSKEQKILPNSPQLITSPKCEVSGGSEKCVKVDGVQKTEDAPPPGFSSPLSENAPPGFSLQGSKDIPPGCSSRSPPHCATHIKSPSVVCMGHFQERFNSHLPVAYGIPFSIMQLGTLYSESDDSWSIAPAMPFQPFPPLPPYPRNTRDFRQPCTVNSVTLNGGPGPERDLPQPCTGNNVTLNGGPERDFPQLCAGNNVTFNGGPERDFPQLCTGNNVTFNGGPERDFPQLCTGNNVAFNGGPERDFPPLCTGNNVSFNGGPERDFPPICTGNNLTYNGGPERDFPQMCTGNNVSFDGGLDWDFPQHHTGNNATLNGGPDWDFPQHHTGNNATLNGGPDWDFAHNNVNFDGGPEEMRMDNRFHGNSYWDQGIPSTSGAANQHMLPPQERGFPNSNNFGRRFNRQRNNQHPRKRNNQHLDNRAPWVRKRFRRGFKGNHPRNGAFISDEQNVNHSVDCEGNSC